MIVRCKYNYKMFSNPMAKNKYIEGVNKFKGADQLIQKVVFYQNLPENKNKTFTVHFEDRFLGIMECPVLEFLDVGETPLHRIRLFKVDG